MNTHRLFNKKAPSPATIDLPQLKNALQQADAILVGAGSGLSAAAGYTYDGDRFQQYFADFIAKYHYRDMYTAGFYAYATPEEYWAYWSRQIYCNRYDQPKSAVYQALLTLLKGKEYFVLTTNVDHLFQQNGFARDRLFYTQGDYGLWQCSVPCHAKTYDNEIAVRRMVAEQKDMRIPCELIPRCPICGEPMTMNLRCDDSFVEDDGWHQAAARYKAWLQKHQQGKILYLELGVGFNTPGIIKYPFWALTKENPAASYICINPGSAYIPEDIRAQGVGLEAGIETVLEELI